MHASSPKYVGALRCGLLLGLALLSLPRAAEAQRAPECTGTDERGASDAFEEGNALMQEAATEARARHRDRARALAAQALEHFDRQCELGDPGALAERGAALMLMGEALRSAQSYDAYLQEHPLDSLDARTRRRIEPNLQPGVLTVELTGHSAARLFIDDLDFGPVERTGALRLPYGEYTVEARTTSDVIARGSIELSATTPASTLAVVGTASEPRVTPVRVEPEGEEHEEARTPDRPTDAVGLRTDYTPWYAITGTATGVFLLTAIGLQLWADERARTYNALCTMGPADGCEAVRTEYDGLFGAFITSYVLTGIAAVGLLSVIIVDATQPAEAGGASPTSLACAPGFEGGVICSGTF